jgi:hypothetical protein
MKNLNNFDITVKVCDFKTPSKSAHKVIDGSFFRSNVLRNPKWQQKLADGLVLGLFTHKGRQPDLQRKEIPYEDNIALSPYLCNVAKDVWVDGDSLYAGLDLFEKREYGALLKDMLQRKMNVPVSMAVRAASDFNNFYVKDLLGVDFTFKPDLEAEIVHVNFSETESDPEDVFCYFSYEPTEGDIVFNNNIIEPTKKIFDMGFSTENYEIFIPPEKYRQLEELDFKFSRDETLVNGMMPITIRNMDNLTKAQQDFISEFDSSANFSTSEPNIQDNQDDDITIFSDEKLNELFLDPEIDFSLQQYLQELKLAPFQVLKKRVMEVIRWVSSNNQERVAKASPTLKSYLDTYILKWVHDVLNNPTEKFNLMLGLRLTNYNIDRRDLIELQRCFNRSKQMLLQNGVMQQSIQTSLNYAYRKVLSGLYDYINKQCSRSGHHLI